MPGLPTDHPARMGRARLALEGLSVGDAFGGRFFTPPAGSRIMPPGPWSFSDDTAMAMGIVSMLERLGGIDPDELALDFARRYRADPHRGYGLTVRRVLDDIGDGVPWRSATVKVYGGAGSMGNGAAMRVAPIGAYFADDFGAVVDRARASAVTTHAHPEGQAGAIAIAVAAAWAARAERGSGRAMLDTVLDRMPGGETRAGVARAASLDFDRSIADAVEALGNGSRITAPDTVPFALWCAARHIDDFAESLWSAAEAGGDNDTNGSIVGASSPWRMAAARSPKSGCGPEKP